MDHSLEFPRSKSVTETIKIGSAGLAPREELDFIKSCHEDETCGYIIVLLDSRNKEFQISLDLPNSFKCKSIRLVLHSHLH